MRRQRHLARSRHRTRETRTHPQGAGSINPAPRPRAHQHSPPPLGSAKGASAQECAARVRLTCEPLTPPVRKHPTWPLGGPLLIVCFILRLASRNLHGTAISCPSTVLSDYLWRLRSRTPTCGPLHALSDPYMLCRTPTCSLGPQHTFLPVAAIALFYFPPSCNCTLIKRFMVPSLWLLTKMVSPALNRLLPASKTSPLQRSVLKLIQGQTSKGSRTMDPYMRLSNIKGEPHNGPLDATSGPLHARFCRKSKRVPQRPF